MKFLAFLLPLLFPLAALAQQTWVINADGLSPLVRTLAGDSIVGASGEAGYTARFGFLCGIAVSGGLVYIADSNKDCIFQLDPATGSFRSVAGGTNGFADGVGASARFNIPYGLAADGAGRLYVADAGNNRIRQVELATGAVTTLAGSAVQGFADGPGTTAQFNKPAWIAADRQGNVYVTDAKSHRVRQIAVVTGAVRTLAGSGQRGFADGPGATTRFDNPEGLALDGKGNLYVADYGNQRIRRIVLATGTVATLAGSGQRGLRDGPGTAAELNQPMGLAADGAGVLYVADRNNHRICHIDLATGTVRTLAGNGVTGFDDGPGVMAEFIGPTGVATDGPGVVYVIDVNYRVRVIK